MPSPLLISGCFGVPAESVQSEAEILAGRAAELARTQQSVQEPPK